MGVIGRPHGVRGLVRVNAYTEPAEALADYTPLVDRLGRCFRLEWAGAGIARLTILTAAGALAVADRDAAARLTNTELFIPRDALAETAADEFYLADLVGLSARDVRGAALGQVTAVHEYGAGSSLEIRLNDTSRSGTNGQADLIVPFTRAAVPVVDVAGGHVVVDPPVEREALP